MEEIKDEAIFATSTSSKITTKTFNPTFEGFNSRGRGGDFSCIYLCLNQFQQIITAISILVLSFRCCSDQVDQRSSATD
jgi:hypothetical protein